MTVIVPPGTLPGQEILFDITPQPPAPAAPQPAPPSLEPAPAAPQPVPLSRENEELERALAASLAETNVEEASPADIHSPEPLIALFEEYRRGKSAAVYEAKLSALSKLYRTVRRIRGEGNCFYRAMWTGWVEQMIAPASSLCGAPAPKTH